MTREHEVCLNETHTNRWTDRMRRMEDENASRRRKRMRKEKGNKENQTQSRVSVS